MHVYFLFKKRTEDKYMITNDLVVQAVVSMETRAKIFEELNANVTISNYLNDIYPSRAHFDGALDTLES